MISLLRKNRLVTAGLSGCAALWIASSGALVAPEAGATHTTARAVAPAASTVPIQVVP